MLRKLQDRRGVLQLCPREQVSKGADEGLREIRPPFRVPGGGQDGILSDSCGRESCGVERKGREQAERRAPPQPRRHQVARGGDERARAHTVALGRDRPDEFPSSGLHAIQAAHLDSWTFLRRAVLQAAPERRLLSPHARLDKKRLQARRDSGPDIALFAGTRPPDDAIREPANAPRKCQGSDLALGQGTASSRHGRSVGSSVQRRC